jgi:L-asparaginase
VLHWAKQSPVVSGLVLGAMGVGHVPSWWVQPLADLAAEKTVVYCSRAGSGPVFSQTYGFAGSEQDLNERGLLPAGSLNLHKARLLLAQCQAATLNKKDCENLFTAWAADYSGVSQAK